MYKPIPGLTYSISKNGKIKIFGGSRGYFQVDLIDSFQNLCQTPRDSNI